MDTFVGSVHDATVVATAHQAGDGSCSRLTSGMAATSTGRAVVDSPEPSQRRRSKRREWRIERVWSGRSSTSHWRSSNCKLQKSWIEAKL